MCEDVFLQSQPEDFFKPVSILKLGVRCLTLCIFLLKINVVVEFKETTSLTLAARRRNDH